MSSFTELELSYEFDLPWMPNTFVHIYLDDAYVFLVYLIHVAEVSKLSLRMRNDI